MAAAIAGAWRWAANGLQEAERHVVANWLKGWSPSDIPDLSGMVALVTGANSGIGFEVSRKLAENGAKVYMVGRDAEKLNAAADQIRQDVGKGAQLEVLVADLAQLDDVVALADKFKRSGDLLHILVNNAGTFFPAEFAAVKGCECTMAVNFLAPALLTLNLLDKLVPGGRVVMVSSNGEAMGDLNWRDIRGLDCKSSGVRVYSRSKLFNIMWARELATRMAKQKAIDLISVHPGIVSTPGHEKMDTRHHAPARLVSTMGKLLGQSAYRGSYSTLFAATAPSLTGKGWAYIGPNVLNLWPTVERKPGNPAASNPVACWRLFEETAKNLDGLVGSTHVPKPRHPDEVYNGK